MNRADIVSKVNSIFCDIFDDDSIVISDEMTAADIDDWDSLEQINLLVAMERAFDIKFSVGEVEGLANVGEMLDLVARKLAEKQA